MHHDGSKHITTLKFLSGKKLILLDIDGTVVQNYNAATLLDSAKAALERLADDDPQRKFALLTNQGGPAGRTADWNLNTDGTLKKDYPTVEQVVERLDRVLAQVITAVSSAVALFVAWTYQDRDGRTYLPEGMQPADHGCNPNWRKPEPGMIYEAMLWAGVTDLDQVVLIGDSSTDWDAAENAGIDSMSAHSFQELGRDHQVLAISFGTGIYRDFEEYELAGLDESATQIALARQVRARLKNYAYIESVEVSFDRVASYGFLITGDHQNRTDDQLIVYGIQDLFVNFDWLRYDSAKNHARGLVNALNGQLRPTLAATISRAYGLDYGEAQTLVDQAGEYAATHRQEYARRKKYRESAEYIHRRVICESTFEFSDQELALLVEVQKMLQNKAGGA